jgi:UDP-N-acetylglucosamine--N-acetylmuramyl-(pentapeptide) pyrophosphoryl-undecaprenol N-acetylglucosamine transferase
MKIVFTGGGSGGHFYPLIAVAEEINSIVAQRNLVKPDLYYVSNTPYDEVALQQVGLEYRHVPAGKLRRYPSFKNGTDFFKTLVGLPTALHLLFRIYPDAVFTKGGYASVPVVLAARILRVPVFVHDSDAIPGRANLLAGKFAKRIAVSYPEAIEYFEHKDRVAYVGNPVRNSVKVLATKGAHEYFQFSTDIPTLLILGGSQGAEAINNTIHLAIPQLLEKYQVIHQVGPDNFETHKELTAVALRGSQNLHRYRMFPFIKDLEYRTAAGCADLIISRAGSGSIFEIAAWNKPSILVPIPEDVSRDQRKNAYAYARTGASEVIEQYNFTPHVLLSELERIFADTSLMNKMIEASKGFARPEAAHTLAQELVKIMLEHELKHE